MMQRQEPTQPAPTSFIHNHQPLFMLIVFFGSYPLCYLVNVLISRELGATDYGDFAVAQAVAALCSTVALMGMDSAVLHFLPVYRQQQTQDLARGFIVVACLTVMVVGIAISLMGYGVIEFIQDHFKLDEHPAMISMLWVLPWGLGILLTRLLAANDRMLLSSFLDCMLLPTVMMLLLGLFFMLQRGLSDLMAVILWIVSRIVVILILAGLLWRIWHRQYRHQSSRFQLQEWLNVALPFLLAPLMLAVVSHSGTLILEAHYASEGEVGLFAAICQAASFPLLALAAISVLAMSELSILAKADDRAQLEQRLGFFVRILTTFGLGSLLVFVVWGEELIRLFGHEFQGGCLPLIVQGVGCFIALAGGLVIPLLQILERKRFVTLALLALMVLNVGFTYLLAPTYGALGASAAYTIAVALVYTAQTYWLQRTTGIPYLRTIIDFRA